MKFESFLLRVLLGALLGLSTSTALSSQGIVRAVPRRDAHGGLLPLQSYDETVRRGMEFILLDQSKWFKGNPATLLDEKGRAQAPYVYYSNLQQDGRPFQNSIDRYVSYPAFHHALAIKMFLAYRQYSGDNLALKKAIELADWNIDHSTPPNTAYGNLPYSTFYMGKPGGFRDGRGVMPDKAAFMALAYLELFGATGNEKYQVAARKIAQTLSRNQSAEGNWPFRVNPTTKKVVEGYTSSVIYAVELFERLDKVDHTLRFSHNRDLALRWLLNNPVRTLDWNGFYEDVARDPNNRNNWDCIDTIRYLLKHRQKHPKYLKLAFKLNHYIEVRFIDHTKYYSPAEGIREQKACFVTMGIHSAHWAAMMAALYQATGEKELRRRAVQTMNYVTYYLQPDNRIVVGFNFKQFWYSCHDGVILYLLDFMGNMPTTAPDGQDHLLKTTDGVRTVQYLEHVVRYQTCGAASSDVLKLASAPGSVLVNGLPARHWNYDSETHILRVRHKGRHVEIREEQ